MLAAFRSDEGAANMHREDAGQLEVSTVSRYA